MITFEQIKRVVKDIKDDTLEEQLNATDPWMERKEQNNVVVKDISQYVNVISSLDFNKKYDVVLLHNTDHEDIAKRVGENTIFVSHSSMVNSANPKLKHNKHITVSGRSKYVLGADMFILNGIDLNKFKSNKLLNKIPKKCLYHNRFKPQKFVYEACEELNIKLDYWKVIEKDVTKKISNICSQINFFIFLF